jgi:hypothetical protein
MSGRLRVVVVGLAALSALAALSELAAPAAMAQRPMQRALEPSMERVLIMEDYLRTVSGLSKHPERLSRSDGYVYLSDLAPVMRYFAETEDRASYVQLRTFLLANMLQRRPEGILLARRFRTGQPFERATPYGYHWTRKALLDAWQAFGDTISAATLAQLVPIEQDGASSSGMYTLSLDCADAMDVVKSDPAPGRAVLSRAKSFVGTKKAREEQLATGSVAAEGEVDLLSCLTRLGVALNDPDAAVRYLDRMLDLLHPFLQHSGRTDLGTGADVLLTLHRVREAGPTWSALPARGAR